MDKHTVTSESIMDPELTVITFVKPLPGDHYVFSADFSDATTSLSHEVLRIFGETFGVPLNLLFEGHRVMGKPVTTGCPMGLPMSWTALSIIHNSICELVDPQRNYRLKGDDLIAYWTKMQIDWYTDLSASVGLVLNDKTIVHPTYGTFCEGDYRLRPGGSRHTAFHLDRLPTFSLKAFVNNEPVPYEIAERFVARGVSSALFADMQRYYHKSWRHLCHEKGVNPYCPRSLGGLGLYTGPNHLLDTHSAKMVRACHNGVVLHREDDTVKGRTLTQLARGAIDRVRYSVHGAPAHDEPVEEAIRHLLSTASFLDALVEPETKKVNRTPGTVVRSLAAFKRKVLRLKCLGGSIPTTVGTAYSVLRRLHVTDAPLVNLTMERSTGDRRRLEPPYRER
jgi:hypothetical protein